MKLYRYLLLRPLSLVALCLGFFMVIIDITIVNVALPKIANKFGAGISDLQWIIDSYALAFAAFLLSAGHLGDRVGARSCFLWGLILFVFASIACGLASNLLVLIIFRFLQGIAAALIVPTSLALINASYDDPGTRAKAIGIWAGIGGIGGAAGPILGALLITWFSWRAIFYVNIPFGILAVFLTMKYVISPKNTDKTSFDWAGQLLITFCIGALAFSLIEAGRDGWLSEPVIFSTIIFIGTLLGFLAIEKHIDAPMCSLSIFHSTTFSMAIIVGMILNIGIYGQLFVLTLYFQEIRNFSVLQTGFAFLPLLGVIAISSYYGGKVTSWLGPRLPMIIGLGVGTIGFFTLLIVQEHTPSFKFLIPELMAMGFGLAFTMPASTVAAIRSAPIGRAGFASGMLNASRQIGTLLGVAAFGTILNMSNQFIIGMHITLIISGLTFFIGCVGSALWIKD